MQCTQTTHRRYGIQEKERDKAIGEVSGLARVGLRTEIVVNVTLLMGAALLLAGFLLLVLTERELLAQRTAGITGTLEIVARAVPRGLAPEEMTNDSLAASAYFLLAELPEALAMEAWGIADRNLVPFVFVDPKGIFDVELAGLRETRSSAAPAVRMNYPAAWLSFAEPPESFAVVSVPMMAHGHFAGALQGRFSLADVRQRVAVVRQVVFLYAFLYGAVLALFSVYFLSRSVVRPIRRLQSMSQRIAAGDLEQAVPVEGPREIADLAGSFNTMAAAIRQSHLETEAHIKALQRANAEVRQTQGELIRSEKMASVGHLAAGMAHEIGNPLGAIVGYLEFLKGESPPGREKEIVERALAEAGRIDRLVRELLDYAAPAGSEPQSFDPVTAMAEAREILRHQGAFDGLELDDRLPPCLPATLMVRHQLVQVFVNLLLNARDASATGGSIRLAGGEKGGLVWLTVADAGAGMTPETLAHIFDPFYTTKAPGKGRGLGLAVCQRVVGEAGGSIDVQSKPGSGSEFTVWLNKAEPAGHDT
jgi:signal transduction histidine kinase